MALLHLCFAVQALDNQESFISEAQKRGLFELQGWQHASCPRLREGINTVDLLKYSSILKEEFSELIKDKAKNTLIPVSLNFNPLLDALYNSPKKLSSEDFDYLMVVDQADDISNKFIENVSIRKHATGFGAYAQETIQENKVIGEYGSEIIYIMSSIQRYPASFSFYENFLLSTTKENKKPINVIKCNKQESQEYLSFFLPAHPILFTVADDSEKAIMMCDAMKMRNEIPLMNHSSRFPNAKLILIFKVVLANGSIDSIVPSQVMVATKEINRDDELLWRYSEDTGLLSQTFAVRDLHPKGGKVCYLCNASLAGICVKCNKCQTAFYCSNSCQEKDKFAHQAYCPKI